jgi:hypothetical protein
MYGNSVVAIEPTGSNVIAVDYATAVLERYDAVRSVDRLLPIEIVNVGRSRAELESAPSNEGRSTFREWDPAGGRDVTNPFDRTAP